MIKNIFYKLRNNKINYNLKSRKYQVRDQIWYQVRDQIWNQVGDRIRDQIWYQVWNQVWGMVFINLKNYFR